MNLQVTNPPIDPLREGLVMSLEMRLGSRGNLLQPGEGAYSQVCNLDPSRRLVTPLCLCCQLEWCLAGQSSFVQNLPYCSSYPCCVLIAFSQPMSLLLPHAFAGLHLVVWWSEQLRQRRAAKC